VRGAGSFSSSSIVIELGCDFLVQAAKIHLKTSTKADAPVINDGMARVSCGSLVRRLRVKTDTGESKDVQSCNLHVQVDGCTTVGGASISEIAGTYICI